MISYVTNCNQQVLMLTLGYATVVFEGLFAFLMWSRRWRWPLLIVGLGLHVGIIVMFPIPWFGLAVVALYSLMVPDGVWEQLRSIGVAQRRAL